MYSHCCYCCYLSRVRNSRLARVGKTAVINGNRKPPAWTMIRFFAGKGQRLSMSERRLDLCFVNLRLAQLLNCIFPFNPFNTHSLMLFSRSLLQFEMIALRNLGLAVLSTSRVWSLDFIRLVTYMPKGPATSVKRYRFWVVPRIEICWFENLVDRIMQEI